MASTALIFFCVVLLFLESFNDRKPRPTCSQVTRPLSQNISVFHFFSTYHETLIQIIIEYYVTMSEMILNSTGLITLYFLYD